MAVIAQERLPLVEYLIMETLAARYRLGEHYWTFPDKAKAHLSSLARRGLIGFNSAPVYGYQTAWLTDAGRACCLSATYKPPARPQPMPDAPESERTLAMSDVPVDAHASPGEDPARRFLLDPDANLRPGNEATRRVLVATRLMTPPCEPGEPRWLPGLSWVPENGGHGNGFASGPGFTAYATDFPEGTRLIVEVRIEPLPPAGEPGE